MCSSKRVETTGALIAPQLLKNCKGNHWKRQKCYRDTQTGHRTGNPSVFRRIVFILVAGRLWQCGAASRRPHAWRPALTENCCAFSTSSWNVTGDRLETGDVRHL